MSGQQHALAALCPREEPGTNLTGDWVGPRAGLERCGKISSPQGLDPRTVEPVAQSLYRLSYAAYMCVYIYYILNILYILHISTYIEDRFKRIFHYFLTKIIRNINFPLVTAHFATPPLPTVLLPKLAALNCIF